MKTSWVVVVSAVLGAMLGVAMAWANFGDSPPLRIAGPQDLPLNSPEEGTPKVKVDDDFFDFGAVEGNTTVHHAFRITNIGNGTLKLKTGGTTCTRCTISEIAKSDVAPGETVEVTVQYEATRLKPQFRQIAVVLTNDPDQRRIELNIAGTVSNRYDIVPQAVTFSKISATGTAKADVKIYGFIDDEIRVAKYEFDDASTAASFEVHSEPIPPEKLDEPKAKCGCQVEVTIKPGLPLGPIRQTIRLTLDMPPSTEPVVAELPIEGQVDADISVVGPNWHAAQARLTFGAVKSSEGATRKLFLILRGRHRHDVTIKPATIDPPWIHVSLGEPTDIRGGASGEGVTQIPLTIEIPPGSPVVSYQGTGQGKQGLVILETDHPQVKQIPVNLSFVIEK